MKRRVRPTLVVGLGEQGLRIAARVLSLADERSQGVPVVRGVAVVAEGKPSALLKIVSLPSPEGKEGMPPEEEWRAWYSILAASEAHLTSALLEELDALHRIDLLRAARSRGWEVRRVEGVAMYLIASLGEIMSCAVVLPLARLMRSLAGRHIAWQATLVGIFLLPDGEAEQDTAALLALQERSRCGEDGCVSPGSPFDEGCYLLKRINERGLSLADDGEVEDMVARWVIELTFTPLGQMLASLPLPAGEGTVYGSFGLATWSFPAQALIEHLGSRLQLELLEALLAPAKGEAPTAAALLRDCCAPPSTWPDEDAPRLRIQREGWGRPPVSHVAGLRAEVDAALDEEWDRLRSLERRGTRVLDQHLERSVQALETEVAALLDSPAGCGKLSRAEEALAITRQAFAWQAEEARAAARYWEEQKAGLQKTIRRAGEALDAAIGRFPPWKLCAWLRVLARPWSWPSVVRQYIEIGRRADAYLACREAEWLLTVRALEQTWLATFYARVADVVEEWEGRLRSFCDRVREMWECVIASPIEEEYVALLLEAAALPPTLARHFYNHTVRTTEGELTALLAVSGPLSELVAREEGAGQLWVALEEYVEKRFAFLKAVRLDELLSRTYMGEELRYRLGDLIEAASPFWACDETDLTAAERRDLSHRVWLGLPCGSDSPLADLVSQRNVAPYDVGLCGEVVAVQVRLGLPLRALVGAVPAELPLPCSCRTRLLPPPSGEAPPDGAENDEGGKG